MTTETTPPMCLSLPRPPIGSRVKIIAYSRGADGKVHRKTFYRRVRKDGTINTSITFPSLREASATMLWSEP